MSPEQCRGQQAETRSDICRLGVVAMLFQLLNIAVTPLTAIMTAQLYLKARHAGGETIDTP